MLNTFPCHRIEKLQTFNSGSVFDIYIPIIFLVFFSFCDQQSLENLLV